jgi:hypothetical protein
MSADGNAPPGGQIRRGRDNRDNPSLAEERLQRATARVATADRLLGAAQVAESAEWQRALVVNAQARLLQAICECVGFREETERNSLGMGE